MKFRAHWTVWAVLLAIAAMGASAAQPRTRPAALPGQGPDAGKIVIYRDTWGVPHLYAPTVEDGLYAQGYAQAEDRPQQLLQNLKMAMGEYSEVVGTAGEQSDLFALLFDHYGTARRAYDLATPRARARLDAFAAGINAWYAAHAEDVPAW